MWCAAILPFQIRNKLRILMGRMMYKTRRNLFNCQIWKKQHTNDLVLFKLKFKIKFITLHLYHHLVAFAMWVLHSKEIFENLRMYWIIIIPEWPVVVFIRDRINITYYIIFFHFKWMLNCMLNLVCQMFTLKSYQWPL